MDAEMGSQTMCLLKVESFNDFIFQSSSADQACICSGDSSEDFSSVDLGIATKCPVKTLLQLSMGCGS